ncbi:hypothetical protein MUK42_34217 [Musa troglodytarum]|uniref:Uncharacterized protein n=1 Tax=Musa troglodytarum TaxID=320322 RepID=A0A9E7I073_9LILI|nr:hypothetical protein MUK42_34217 [Musa troglodytarum]
MLLNGLQSPKSLEASSASGGRFPSSTSLCNSRSPIPSARKGTWLRFSPSEERDNNACGRKRPVEGRGSKPKALGLKTRKPNPVSAICYVQVVFEDSNMEDEAIPWNHGTTKEAVGVGTSAASRFIS